MLWFSVALSLFALLGCSADPQAPAAAVEQQASVDIGVPAGDGLDFEHLEPGTVLKLQTFGQGGTHVLLAVRTVGFGSRAFVAMTLRNLVTDAEVTAPAPVRAQLFICDGDACDLVPLLVMTAGLAETLEERDGLAIEITADVHNDAGVTGRATREAVLSTEDLL
jgi:hypothetical protein